MPHTITARRLTAGPNAHDPAKRAYRHKVARAGRGTWGRRLLADHGTHLRVLHATKRSQP